MTNHYDYKTDKPLAEQCEYEIACKIVERFGCDFVSYNNDNKYDILFKTKDDKYIKVEVKQDFTCARTGNVGVEYECRGKASGIQKSEADLYCFRVHETKELYNDYLIQTKILKNMILSKLFKTIVVGGDVGSNSKNFLFDLEVLKAHSTKL
jgi:hypothetical protein